MFRPHWVCPAQGCLCFPRLHCSGSRPLYMERALSWVRFQFSAPPQKRGFGCACVLCLPQPQQSRQPGAWAPSPWARRTFSLCSPSARPRWGLRKSSDRNRGPVCRVGGGGFSGAEFAPCLSPCLLPPAGMGRLFSGVSQSLCFANRQAVCSGQLIFPSLSHSLKKSPSDCSQGLLAGPHPKECRRLLSVPPPLAGSRCGRRVLFCWELLLGTESVGLI